MIIKLTRRTARADFDEQPVYINTNYITDFYADYLRINEEPILCTTIHLTECSISVAETPEVILKRIHPIPLYLDTDSLPSKDKRDLCKMFLNGTYGTTVYPNTDEPTIK